MQKLMFTLINMLVLCPASFISDFSFTWKCYFSCIPRIPVWCTPLITTRFLASCLKKIIFKYCIHMLLHPWLSSLPKKSKQFIRHTPPHTASAELYYNHCLKKHRAISSISSVSLWATCIMIPFSVLQKSENMGVRRSRLCEEADRLICVPVCTGFAWAGTFWNGWAGCQPVRRCGSRPLAPCPAGTRSGPGCPWCGRPPAGPSLGTHSRPSPGKTRAWWEGGWKQTTV